MVRHTPIESFKPEPEFTEPEFTKPAAAHPVPQMPAAKPSYQVEPNVDLWVNEQLFEEDVRAVLRMMHPTAASGCKAGTNTAPVAHTSG